MNFMGQRQTELSEVLEYQRQRQAARDPAEEMRACLKGSPARRATVVEKFGERRLVIRGKTPERGAAASAGLSSFEQRAQAQRTKADERSRQRRDAEEEAGRELWGGFDPNEKEQRVRSPSLRPSTDAWPRPAH
jgi:hypothetical protein